MKTATVKKHVARILEKLGVENRTAAALRERINRLTQFRAP